MKLTKYSKVFSLDKDEYCLYNSINGSLVTIPSNSIHNNEINIDKLTKEDISTLTQYKFINISDKKLLDELKKNYSNDSEALILSIELTRQCNLRCAYWGRANISDKTHAKMKSGYKVIKLPTLSY